MLGGSTLKLPAAEDEATVNAAAVILLQSITRLLGSDFEWVFDRTHFVCTLQATKFNAYTDGALRSKENQDDQEEWGQHAPDWFEKVQNLLKLPEDDPERINIIKPPFPPGSETFRGRDTFASQSISVLC